MNVRLHSSPSDFGPVVRWVYRRNPVLFTSELTTLRTSPWPTGQVLVSVTGDGSLGAAVQGGDGCLLVSGLTAAQAGRVAAELAGAGLASVRGTPSAAAAFAQGWSTATGGHAVHTREDLLYRLGELVPPVGVPGEFRYAGHDDDALIVAWLDGFFADSFGAASDLAGRAEYLKAIVGAGGRIVLWVADGVAVSMARVHAPVAGMARIGPVYTPPGFRGHGYAAAVTSTAAEHARRLGVREVVLFADVNYAASNRVYRRIGFRPVVENVHVDLVAGTAANPDARQVSAPGAVEPTGRYQRVQ